MVFHHGHANIFISAYERTRCHTNLGRATGSQRESIRQHLLPTAQAVTDEADRILEARGLGSLLTCTSNSFLSGEGACAIQVGQQTNHESPSLCLPWRPIPLHSHASSHPHLQKGEFRQTQVAKTSPRPCDTVPLGQTAEGLTGPQVMLQPVQRLYFENCYVR